MTTTTAAPPTTCVLGTYEVNGYDDSDFFAIVWNGEKVTGEFWRSTAHATVVHHGPDATAEQDRAARAWITGPLFTQLCADAEDARLTIADGVQARSTTTRGKNKGLTGTVARIARDSYRSTRYESRYRAELVLDDGTRRWMHAENLMRTDAPPVDPEQIRHQAARAAANHSWSALLSAAGMRKR